VWSKIGIEAEVVDTVMVLHFLIEFLNATARKHAGRRFKRKFRTYPAAMAAPISAFVIGLPSKLYGPSTA
jgi:hypothetical protein